MSVERRRNLMGATGGVTKGVYILYTDGDVSPYNTTTPGKTPVGVILKNEYVSFVIHPSESSGSYSSSEQYIPGVAAANTRDAAVVEYAGESNTNAAIASGRAGYAFTFARNVSYADGRTGYLPACGEMEQMRLNIDNINTALGLIGGTQLNFSSRFYWTSTQRSDTVYAWLWSYIVRRWSSDIMTRYCSCRSVAAYE